MHDSGVGSLRKSQSTEQTGPSLNNSPRSNHARNLSLDHGTSQFSPTSTADTSMEPGSSHRAQSALFGNSRPPTSQSRPGTAGSDSLMNAVNRAADAVARAESEYQQSADTYTQNHFRPKAPRYIDIFSLSSPNRAQSALDYNEDVASRNLDLARVALESTHPRTIPYSKFQEEVAIRNAYPNLTEVAVPESPPTVQQDTYGTNVLPSSKQDFSSRVGYQSQSTPRNEDRPISRHQYMHSSVAGDSYRQSEHSWGSQPQVHELPSPRNNMGGAVTSQTPTKTSPSGGNIHGRAFTAGSIPDQHLGSEGAEPRVHEDLHSETLRKYQLSPTEVTQLVLQQRNENTANPVNGSRVADHPFRSLSAIHHMPSVRRAINLPNRTIMDLTGDDSDIFYSETNPESSNYSSPVLEHAKIETLQRIKEPGIPPAVTGLASTEAGMGSELDKPTVSSLPEVSQITVVEVTPPQPPQDPVSESSSAAAIPTTHITTSTSRFSPINTVVSVPPRASVILETPTRSNIVNVMESRLDFEEQETTGTEDAHQTPPDAHRSTNSESSNQATGLPGPFAQQPTSQSHISVEDDRLATVEAIDHTNHHQPDLQVTPRSQRYRGSGEPPSVQPYIHMTDDSPHSIDHRDQDRASGVIARDFANTPTKSTLTSVPEEVEVNGSERPPPHGKPKAQSRHSADDLSNGTAYVNGQMYPNTLFYRSTFNESEFAQKQAEARAALIRLQQSLNEDFLIQTAPAPVVARSSKSGTSKHTASYSDGKPAAPSSIFAQVRNESPVPSDFNPGLETSPEKLGSGTSFHMLTTVSDNGVTESVRDVRSSHPPKPRQDYHGKGKQRAETELNGPGPTIWNEKPLPLPPPLHANGHPVHRVYLQSSLPPSPGEISLSSFPIPVSSPRQSVQQTPKSVEMGLQDRHTSHHSQSSSGGGGRLLRRQSSQRSQASSTSAFSIPYHMIPDRSSSIRE